MIIASPTISSFRSLNSPGGAFKDFPETIELADKTPIIARTHDFISVLLRITHSSSN
jgi:hypothetical protein